MKKTFLLGVGCQKGGTSWLYRYLREHPNANLGFKKEYHVFDGMYLSECEGYKKRNSSFIRFRKLQSLRPKKIFQTLKYRGFYSNVDNYFSYFNSCLDETKNIYLTGDITPGYSGLPADVFRLIKSKLDDLGVDAKVVFLMRDPVERCISAVRMMRRNSGKVSGSSEEEDLLKAYSTPGYQLHTQYELGINNLESVFGREDIHYAFYESMFSEKEIHAITDFLSIPYIKPDFQKQYNVSRTNNVISENARRKVFDFYEPTYKFVVDKFGIEMVESLWANYRKFKT